MTKQCDLFLFAGEPSGDAHGSLLIDHLIRKDPSITIQGVFGIKMRAFGFPFILPSEEFAVMGFSDVLKKIFTLRRHFYTVLNHILKTNPKVVVLIDYPGFNLRLAKALKKHHFHGKIIQYISPSVWAWKKRRIKGMEENLDLLLCIFPFEPDFFKTSSLKAIYVGNPTFEMISKKNDHHDWRESLKLPSGPIIALFPGSRKDEIIRNLPIQLEAACKLQQEQKNSVICISVANEITKQAILSFLKDYKNCFLIPEQATFDLMQHSHLAIAKCGTVTLELALFKIPTVVTYQLSAFNGFLAEHIFKIKLPFYSIANILLNQQVFPELIYKKLSLPNLLTQVKSLFFDTKERKECLEKCKQLKALFELQETKRHTASDVIFEYLNKD